MIDNFDLIKHRLRFEDDKFYFLQLIQRKKDHSNKRVSGTNNNNRLIKAYYVRNIDYFDFIKDEVIELCNVFKARACINLNRRSWKKMAFLNLKKVTDQIMNEDYRHAYKSFPHVCGRYSQEPDKTWIIDVDRKVTKKEKEDFFRDLNQIQPEGEKYRLTVPSLNGEHWICSPFNLQEAKPLLQLYGVEIHKNNPTNLYIPDL